MFDTKSLCVDMVARSPLATVLSTSGLEDSRYLAANDAYLTMVERVWSELDGESLIRKGSAISNTDRDRRLWMLDNRGFYDCEPAVVGASSGRRVTVEISAQRIWCSGSACNLEFFRAPPAAARTPGTETMGGVGPAPRASFLPELEGNLARLSPLNRTILMRRMLAIVAEGGILLGRVNTNPSIARYAAALRDRMEAYICDDPAQTALTKLDFTPLDGAAAERHLLELAGEIWGLVHFAKDADTADLLKRLVVPYTRPGSRIVTDGGN